MRQLVVFGILASGAWAQTIQVHGHRGARAMRPENTLPAFEYAIAQGVDALELDMAVTKDGVIVVSHDPELRAPVCTGPRDGVAIHSLTLAEVRRWDCGVQRNPLFPKQQPVPGTKMPTLDQVFTLAPKGRFLFNIETKITPQQPELAPPPDEFVRLVLAEIRKHGLESRVVLQSFDFRTLHEMKKVAPEIRLSALYSGMPRDFVEIGREAGAQIVSPEYHLITAERVKAAHAAGFEVLPWTANTPEDWANLVAAGVDGIISDDPAALIAYLKKR
jgi:glycerophosphoryl diester phosphodiesterase